MFITSNTPEKQTNKTPDQCLQMFLKIILQIIWELPNYICLDDKMEEYPLTHYLVGLIF